ncbi:hypothetical protein [Streptomyces nigra]|uniref:hypothetical protein n=1 Tax=Streptomyces nigra TaxID=1827580 RepID=UPI00341D7443
MTAIAVMTALTGCSGGDGVGEAGDRATATARAADKKAARDELTVNAVRSDVRAAAAAADMGRRLTFADRDAFQTPCRVLGVLRTEDVPKRAAVDSVTAVLKSRGWGHMQQVPSEEDGQVWHMEKNGWRMFLAAGKVPEGAGISFSATGKACGVPMPSRPAVSGPAERPVLP